MSPRMETPQTSLVNLCQCLTTFIVKRLLSCPLLQILTIASHPVTWYYWEEYDCMSFVPYPHQVLTHLDPPSLSHLFS